MGRSEWKEVRLGDFLKVKHGYAFKGKYITKEENPNILVPCLKKNTHDFGNS